LWPLLASLAARLRQKRESFVLGERSILFLTLHVTTGTTATTLTIIGHTPRCGPIAIAIDIATIGEIIIAITGETIAAIGVTVNIY
jgi:hypothetical protein